MPSDDSDSTSSGSQTSLASQKESVSSNVCVGLLVAVQNLKESKVEFLNAEAIVDKLKHMQVEAEDKIFAAGQMKTKINNEMLAVLPIESIDQKSKECRTKCVAASMDFESIIQNQNKQFQDLQASFAEVISEFEGIDTGDALEEAVEQYQHLRHALKRSDRAKNNFVPSDES